MRIKRTSQAAVLHTLNLVLNVGMVAFLIVASFLIARPVQAAVNDICTTTADGDWSTSSIWDCGRVPLNTDDAVIAHEVSFTTDQAVHSLTIDSFGTLRFEDAKTLTINGNFTKAIYAVFDPGNDFSDPVSGGTVIFGPGSNTITTNDEVVDFYNLTKIASGAGETLSVDPQGMEGGYVHVLNALILNGVNGSSFLSLRSTSPGSQWGILSDALTDINYVDVQDSNNLGDLITVASGHDSLNNTNWSFSTMQSLSSVSLSSSANPSVFSNPITITATISPVGAASGTVEFYLDGNPIAACLDQPVSLVGGVPTATCVVTGLTVGNHNIGAEYSGNADYFSSTADTFVQQVVKSTSTVGVTSSQNPSIVGNPVTLTATVIPSAADGTVTFKSGGSAIAGCESKTVASGSAQCIIDLAVGSYDITVDYSGSAAYEASTSTTLVQDVVKITSTVGVVSSQNPSVVGNPVTLTATVTPLTASGTVTFKSGVSAISGCENVALASGSAQCIIDLAVGSHDITVEYSGDSVTSASTSSTLTQVVAAQVFKFYIPSVNR